MIFIDWAHELLLFFMYAAAAITIYVEIHYMRLAPVLKQDQTTNDVPATAQSMHDAGQTINVHD